MVISAAQLSLPVHVPTDGGWGSSSFKERGSRLLVEITLQQGHPLRQGGLVRKHWGALGEVLLPLVGSPQRVEMVKRALWLQSVCGVAFPSAGYLARRAGGCPKTWNRCLAALRARGWARTARLRRPNGQQSVNLLDLSGLWAVVRGLLQRIVAVVGRITRWEKVRGTWWVKVAGAWATLEEAIALTPGGEGVGRG